MYLKQPTFTYSACGSFSKNKERIETVMQIEKQIISTKMIFTKLVFNMIRLMVNTNIRLKEQNR